VPADYEAVSRVVADAFGRENEARQLARYVIGSRRHLNQPNSATALFDGTADFGPSPEWY
jgi:hypothetical protein